MLRKLLNYLIGKSGKPQSEMSWIEKILLEARFAVLMFILTFFVVQPFVVASYEVPTPSMEPTIMTHTRFIALPSVYGGFFRYTNIKLPGLKEVKRDDIVMFRFPQDPSQDFVKRAIGLPGDTVMVRDKAVYINGHELNEPYAHFQNGPDADRPDYGPEQVPKGHIFVMGDNRDNSWDSRYWGFVPVENVFGTPLVTFWSYDQDHHRIRENELFKVIK